MGSPYAEWFKMMNLPMELSSKFYEVTEKATKAMNSMAKAQKDM